jgi:uncharacterized protein YndB with AHSA1/START domain
MTRSAADEKERMVITRVFDAPRELVWKAWTEPEYAKQWWGPKGFTAPVCNIDFRVGGKYLYCMRSPEGKEIWTGGEYYEIVPPEKIVFSMYMCDEKGNKVDPSHYGLELTPMEDVYDEVMFEDLGDGRTRLVYLGNEAMEEAKNSGQVEGWEQILDKLAAVLAKHA